MRIIFMLLIQLNSCYFQEYKLQFYDMNDNIVYTLIKYIDNDQKCITFTIKEQNSIRDNNLNNGRLHIFQKDSLIHSFDIIDVYTSKIYSEDTILLCEPDGKLKFNEPVCIKVD